MARAKLKGGKKYYGAYLGGFPERARALLGCKITDPVLHVCGGCARDYPYKRGFGLHDKTLDLDATLQPDFLQDARKPYPFVDGWTHSQRTELNVGLANAFDMTNGLGYIPWGGILADPPYSKEDAKNYAVGDDVYPSPNQIVSNAFDVLPVGGRVGIIHYILPKPPKNSVFVACISVVCGFNNRMRCYAVFEKL